MQYLIKVDIDDELTDRDIKMTCDMLKALRKSGAIGISPEAYEIDGEYWLSVASDAEFFRHMVVRLCHSSFMGCLSFETYDDMCNQYPERTALSIERIPGKPLGESLEEWALSI